MAFATAEDIAAWPGVGALTDAQTETVEILLDAATAVIAEAASKDDDWATALDPIPNVLRFLCVALVVRIMPNPGGLVAFQEALGQYSTSQRFADAAGGGGLMLSEIEERLVRRAVYGTTTGSVKTESLATEIADLVYGCGS